MKVIKAVSISQAEAVWNAKDMNPQKFGEVVKVGGEGEEGGGAGAGKGCTEVGCKGESGVWWCGEVSFS